MGKRLFVFVSLTLWVMAGLDVTAQETLPSSVWAKLHSLTPPTSKFPTAFIVTDSRPSESNETLGNHCEVTLISLTMKYEGFSKKCEHLPGKGSIVWAKVETMDISLADIKFRFYKQDWVDPYRTDATSGSVLALSDEEERVTPKPTKPLTYAELVKSKVDGLAEMCRTLIVKTSKDPTSVSFVGPYSYGPHGGLLFRNWINITIPIIGRNTYGAVLRHDMVCEASCNEKQGTCKLETLEDYPL